MQRELPTMAASQPFAYTSKAVIQGAKYSRAQRQVLDDQPTVAEGHGQMGCRSSALEKHEKALSTQKDCSACDVMNGDLRKLSHHLR